MDYPLDYPLDAKCKHCGYTFGEHCTADDACPTYYTRPISGHKHHAGFNRANSFTTDEGEPKK